MNVPTDPRPKPSAHARAEAAAWIARLHGPNRSPEVEAGLRQWLAEDPARAAALEFMTDVWEKSARLRRRPVERLASWELPGFRLSASRAALAAAAIALIAAVGTFWYLRPEGVSTAVGEQRTLALEDGTRVYLNTDTQLVAHYDERVRRVELKRGEAMFEVAKRPTWPFIVTAGDRQVRALGTAFVVRRDANQVAVTLVEGKVTVAPAEASAADSASTRTGENARAARQVAQGSQDSGAAVAIYTLAPGQRVTFGQASEVKLDQPPMDKVMAWQRGQVSLDNALLADAVAEMNRYSRVRLVVEDPRSAAIRISGIFRAGEQENFAQAVARTYRLEVHAGAREIILTRPAERDAGT